MSIRFDKVTIRVSELQTTTVVVPPWETPVLQAMYGDEAEVTGREFVKRDLPEAGDEFARLATRYGPKNVETPTVAAVYGKFGPGVRLLAEAIQSAVEGETFAPVRESTAQEIEAAQAIADQAATKVDETAVDEVDETGVDDSDLTNLL